MTSTTYPAWKCEERSPLETQLQNILHTRQQPWNYTHAGWHCVVQVPTLPAPMHTASCFMLYMGTARCLVELDEALPVTLHPALEHVADTSLLPQELSLAVQELLVSPFVDAFSSFIGSKIRCEALANDEQTIAERDQYKKNTRCTLPLLVTLTIAKEQHEKRETFRLSLCLSFDDTQSIALLCNKLLTLPSCAHDYQGVHVPVHIEAGSMHLSITELATLEPDDVLLPDTYPALQGRVVLRLDDTLAHCSVINGQATIESIVYPISQGDTPVSENQNDMESADTTTQGIRVGEIEVSLSFELERRSMTVADIGVLSPGYTFALGVDPTAPVTLCISGRPVGTGRLVDIGGVMGVQVLTLDTSHTASMAASAAQAHATAQSTPTPTGEHA